MWGGDMARNLGNISSSSASTTRDNDSSMEGINGTLGVVEDRGECQKVMRLRGRPEGRKARTQRQGGHSQQAGDGDGTNAATKNILSIRDGTNEAQ